MPEWSNGTVSKTVVRATVPRVRIPLFPPSVAEACATAKALAHAVSVGDLPCLKMLSSCRATFGEQGPLQLIFRCLDKNPFNLRSPYTPAASIDIYQ